MSSGMRKSDSISSNSVPGGGKQSGVPPSVFPHSNCPPKFFFNDRQVGSSSEMVEADGTKRGTSHEGRSRKPPESPAVTRREEAPVLPETAHVVRPDAAGELPASLKTSSFNSAPAADTSHLDPKGRRETAQTHADQQATRTDFLRAHARDGYADAARRNTGETGAGAAHSQFMATSTTYRGRGGKMNTRVYDLVRGYV